MIKIDFLLHGKSYTVSFRSEFSVAGENDGLEAYQSWILGTEEGQEFNQKRLRLISRGYLTNDLEADPDDCLPKVEAKQEYFLDTRDLSGVFYQTEYPGFGAGSAPRLYKRSTLEALATRKFGADGLAEKRAKRAKRAKNELLKSIKANDKKEEMEQAMQRLSLDCFDQNSKELRKIRVQVRKQLKPSLTSAQLREKCSSGFNVVVQVPRVERAEFAALIGRPIDTNLSSSHKKGAWYSEEVPFTTFFDSDDPIVGTGRNGTIGIDPDNVLTVKYKPSDQTLSVTVFVQHVGTFGYNSPGYKPVRVISLGPR